MQFSAIFVSAALAALCTAAPVPQLDGLLGGLLGGGNGGSAGQE